MVTTLNRPVARWLLCGFLIVALTLTAWPTIVGTAQATERHAQRQESALCVAPVVPVKLVAPAPEPKPNLPEPIFGIDVSNHQAAFDMAAAAAAGVEFAFIKATEGNWYADPWFARNLANARDAGLIVAAYHYQRPGSAVSQAEHIASVVPTDVPVLIDVEGGSGSIALTRELVAELEQRGYQVPLVYIPHWYWAKVGRPDLSGLPPLWASHWPTGEYGTAVEIWNNHREWLLGFWRPYGGNPVRVLQFTDSASVAGHTIDANIFRGNRRELKQLLYE